MTTPNEVYERWAKDRPRRRRRIIPGYRPCLTTNCGVYISLNSERLYCYGCGGQPDTVKRPQRPGEVWRQYVEDKRRNLVED